MSADFCIKCGRIAEKTTIINGQVEWVCLRCASGVVNPIRNLQKGVGRNDSCPCGSGKKFKKCCLGKGPMVLPFIEMKEESDAS